ncbi:BRO family protein, partial [Nocardia sp. NPDC019302]|uniref:BRO family protein n=1 Tax=Nocardia sp. NPDC019302 TaxID=3154592 RepID=UPI0034068BB3
MSTELMPFTYEGATVRTVVIDGEPWFVLADLCRVLEIANVSNVASRIDPTAVNSIRLAEGNRGNPNVTIVNESGMYEVVIRSDKPEAVAFRRWITGTVLPEIRRTGSFNAPQHAIPATYAEALREAATQFERAEVEKAARIEAEQHAELLAVPAAAWTSLEEADGDYEVADAAKILSRDPAISIGQNRLFEFMAEQKWVF